MANVSVIVLDATGNRKQQVDVPDDAPIERLIAVLVERMRFPQNGPDGQLLSYKLQHRNTGRQLLDEQTLAIANVKDGDVLRLMPEITAGADSASVAGSTVNLFRSAPSPAALSGRAVPTRPF